MKIQCPACQFSADVDPAKIPTNGAKAKCPSCANVFPVPPPVLAVPEKEEIVCPKCGAAQEEAEICGLCGIVFSKYRAAEELRQTSEARKATAVSHAEGTFRLGYGRGEIMAWAGDGYLAPDDVPEALRIAGSLPSKVAWGRFLDGVALWLGAVFLAAAVIFFFAYNWKELGHFSRFGIVELLLIGAVLAAWRLGLGQMPGKAALLVATLLVGALLALVGQTYQTGADPWELFATWAAFILPWVAISGFAPLWLLLLALVNLSVGLYHHAFAGIFGIFYGTESLWWILAGVNTAALAAWELAADRGFQWLSDRWPPRMVATVAAGYITILAVWGITGHDTAGIVETGGYLVWLAGAYAVYRHRVRDLYVLALGVLSLVIYIAVFLGHTLLRGGEAGAFFFIGMTVLGLSAAGGWWLRNIAQEVQG